MKIIRYISQFLGAVAVLFLLSDVFLKKSINLPVATRQNLVNTSYVLVAVSTGLLIIYYYKARETKKIRQLLLFIVGILIMYFLLVFFS